MANYLSGIGVYKNAFNAKDGTLKKNLVAKDMNAQAISSNIRVISGALSHKPVSSQETITESAREAKSVIERVIGERASVVITNDSTQNRAFYNPSEGVIYINNKANLSGEDVAKFVAMHEITHTTEGTEYYDELEEVLVDISKDASAPQALKDKIGDLKERQVEIGRKYEEQLKNQNALQQIYTVETERNADLIGELLGNDYYINKLANRNLPLLKKLYLKIKGLIKKNADTDSASAKYLNKLASKFAKAIDHSQGGVKISQLGPNEDEENRLEIEPVRFSKEIVPGSDEMFVLVEKASIQKLMSYPGETMQAKVRNYLKQFRGTVLPLGSTNKVYIRREAEGEYTNPAKSVSEIDYEGKLNAASEFENLLQSAKYLEHKEDNGRHPDATRGWNYYELKYVVPTSNGIRAYKGQIQIKLIDRGDCFYDITKIEDITSGSAGQALIKAAGSAYVSSNNSISEKTENVNDFEENNDVRYSKVSSEPEFVKTEDGVRIDFGNPLEEIGEERRKKVKAEAQKRYEYSEQARRESEESLLLNDGAEHILEDIFYENEKTLQNGDRIRKRSPYAENSRLKKYIADNILSKVYALGDSKELLKNILGDLSYYDEYDSYKVALKGASRKSVERALWDALNTSVPGEQTKAALEIADYIISTATANRVVEYTEEMGLALRTVGYLRQYLHQINLDYIKEDIKVKYDKDKSVFARWQKAKDKRGVTADSIKAEFEEVTGLRIDAINEADIFLALDEIYMSSLEVIKDNVPKKSTLMGLLDEKAYHTLQQKIAREVLQGFDKYGKESRFSVLEKKYVKEINKLSESAKNAYEYNRLANSVLRKVQKIVDSKNGKYKNATQSQTDVLKNVKEMLAKIKHRANLNKSSIREIMAELSKWYIKENPVLQNFSAIDGDESKNIGFFSKDIRGLLDYFSEENNVQEQQNNGKTKREELSYSELQLVNIILAHMNHIFDNYGKIYKHGRRVEADSVAREMYDVMVDAEKNQSLFERAN